MHTINSSPEKLLDTIRAFRRILSAAIQQRFDSMTWQLKTDNKLGNALMFCFRTKDSTLTPSLLLYAPANYVYVFFGEFNHIPNVHPLEDWKFKGCHDSCWRDNVDNFLLTYSEVIESTWFMDFGRVIPMTQEMYDFMKKVRLNKYKLT